MRKKYPAGPSVPGRWSVGGSVIAYALVIMSAVSVLFLSIVTFITSQIRNADYAVTDEQSFQIAESGVDYYKWYLAHGTAGRTAQQIQEFWESASGVDAPYEAEYFDPSGGAVGRYSIEVDPPEPGSTIAEVRSTAWTYRNPDQVRKVKVRFRRPSWSEHAVLSNAFVRFGEGTETYGKLHSNQGMRFDGLAHNIVTSAVSSVDDTDHGGGQEFGVHTHVNTPPSTGTNDSFRAAEAPPNAVPVRSDVFEAGRDFPATSVDFTGVIGDLSLMKSEAQSGNGRYFPDDGNDDGRRIILRTNGTFDMCRVRAVDAQHNVTSYKRSTGNSGNCSSCGGNNCTTNYPIPDGGVIFVEDDVWLSGRVDGDRVSVVAANLSGGTTRSVYIPNDLRYDDYDGEDIIGVIGQMNVDIPQNSEDNLRIDAALLAQQGKVGRSNYGTSDHKSVITVFGAIATNLRYGFAWTNGVSDWGYETRNLYYDNNLLYYPPPYFPTGTEYLIDLWEES